MKQITMDFDLYEQELREARSAAKREAREEITNEILGYLQSGKDFIDYFNIHDFNKKSRIRFWMRFLHLTGRENQIPKEFNQRLLNEWVPE